MISDRKLEHLWLCSHCEVEYRHKKTGFEDIELIHNSIPEINQDDIDLSTKLWGKKLDSPLLISAITGGHPAAGKINRTLAKAADKMNIAMGLGSQRAGVENPQLKNTYTVVREEAPQVLLLGNIGSPQLEYALQATEMLDIDALAIHLNPLQEAIQPGGDVSARGQISSIRELKNNLDLPLVAKETGAGVSAEDALKLEEAGIDAIDVAGAGGTSWAAVETYRAVDKSLGELFWDWGIPTAISTVEVIETVKIPVISSGGIRNGIQAAKALAIGAKAVGIALPLLKEALKGPEAVIKWIEDFNTQLRVAMFLAGASSLEELGKSNLIIKGKTREWLQERGFNTQKYARRG